MLSSSARVLSCLASRRWLATRSQVSFAGAEKGSDDAATAEDIRKYSDVVCEEVRRVHEDYASKTDPEQFSQEELGARVQEGVSRVRRRYVGLPKEEQEADDAWARDLQARIQQRNSAKYRDDWEDRRSRVAAKNAMEKEMQKKADSPAPARQYEVVQR